ncbi:MAG TPA: energy-coupling factor ABC transporter ATP-binding protein [Burkholderiales bacterium]|nr:energy-coupling factor ABC transporter ATP-binding protein [Burkholderiales bacterium]
MSGPLLQIDGLRKNFGSRRILDIECLELHAGESYVVTGDNGVGKTTLLRIIAGLESAQVTNYQFDGWTISLENFPHWLRREIIYMHQHPYLFKTTVAANIGYGLKARNLPKVERVTLVREAMEWAGVVHLNNVPPQRLSGGEKQRVALARTKVLKPKLYLLDEPTANLDAEARRQAIELIQRLCLDNNCILIACHDYELIHLPRMRRMTLSDGQLLPQVATASLERAV